MAKRTRDFPDLHPSEFDLAGLDPRDRALAIAIDRAVVRHWRALATALESHLSRPWQDIETKVQAVLLVGAAQLIALDRIPDHAAIDNAVGFAKRFVRKGAGGLVNAVLRRIADARDELVATHDPERRDEIPLADGRAWRLRTPIFDEDPWRRLAAQTSHGDELVHTWFDRLDLGRARAVALHSLMNAPVIVTGLDESVARSLESVTPHDEPGFHTVAPGALDELLAAHPEVRVQDPTSARAVNITAAMKPETIIDLCAGKGTKTRQLRALHPDARIIATDRDLARHEVLARTFADDPQVEIVPFDSIGNHTGTADLLVLDVPCSNSGVLARRPEAKYRFSPLTRRALVDVQRQIVADSLLLLTPAGKILYATCSLEPQENEEQVRWIEKWHPYRERAVSFRWPTGGPGDPPARYTDGGFASLLAR